MPKSILPVFLVAIVVLVCACGNGDLPSLPSNMTKPTIRTIPENWSLEEDSPYGTYEDDSGDTQWGLIYYTDQTDQDLVMIYYGDVPAELKGHESDENALIERATLEASEFPGIDEAGSMRIAGNVAGYVKGRDPEDNKYNLDIVLVDNATCLDIYASFDPTDDDEAQVMSLINSISMD